MIHVGFFRVPCLILLWHKRVRKIENNDACIDKNGEGCLRMTIS